MVDVGNASLDPMGGWFEGRGDALSKGVGDCVRPVDLSGRCGPVSAQGRARSSTPGIVHRRSWHSTTGGWVSRTHVGRVGGDAASSPRPAGDDAGRGRLCTTLRRDELHRRDGLTGRTQSPTPLDNASRDSPGWFERDQATRCPHRPQPLRRLSSFHYELFVRRRVLNELHEPTLRNRRSERTD